MSRTGAQLLEAFSQFLNDYWSSTTTSAGASDGTTLVDSLLSGEVGDRDLDGGFVRIVEAAHAALYGTRRVAQNTNDTLTVEPAFSGGQIASGVDYEYHRHDPIKKFRALDAARSLAFPQVARIILDESLTGDGKNHELAIPSVLRRGPMEVWQEEELGVDVSWNFLTSPRFDSLSGWTDTTLTASLLARLDGDDLLPKYDDSNCTKLAGASGSYAQTVGSMRGGITAARAAGRKVTFGVWVYCNEASRVTVKITDDSGSSSSDAHPGTGWFFLEVTHDVADANASALTVSLEVAAGASMTCYLNRGWFLFGDRVPLRYGRLVPRRGVWRTDDDAELHLERAPERGRQLRLIGRQMVTALGSTPATQVTNSMEVDEGNQDLLFAKAARILLEWEGMAAGEAEALLPEILTVERRFSEQQEDWKRRYPRSGTISGWWSER